MSPSILPPLIINPTVPVTASVICLHGLGADGHDLQSIVTELDLPQQLGVRFVFPHAPYRPVTINNGYVMRAWYDIVAADLSLREDRAGIEDSERLLRELIQAEIDTGVAAERIVLAGFSQGGAIALHTGLRYPQRLAGIVALSTYLPLAVSLAVEAAAVNASLPILLAHGSQDDIVPLAQAQASRQRLEDAGHALNWHVYTMPHSLCVQEIQDIRAWLLRLLMPTGCEA